MGSLHISTDPPLLAPETIAYAEACRTAFGLAEWKIWLSEHDAPGGDTDTAGYTDLNTRYLQATITILRGLSPERVREVLFHEFLHVAMAWLDQAVRHIVARLPQDDRLWALSLYEEMEDQTIERLTRALRRHLEPTDQPAAEAA